MEGFFFAPPSWNGHWTGKSFFHPWPRILVLIPGNCLFLRLEQPAFYCCIPAGPGGISSSVCRPVELYVSVHGALVNVPPYGLKDLKAFRRAKQHTHNSAPPVFKGFLEWCVSVFSQVTKHWCYGRWFCSRLMTSWGITAPCIWQNGCSIASINRIFASFQWPDMLHRSTIKLTFCGPLLCFSYSQIMK